MTRKRRTVSVVPPSEPTRRRNQCEEDFALLPWEDVDAWHALRDEYRLGHAPAPGAERTIVNRLAWIEWRRRRCTLAERAVHLAAFENRVGDLRAIEQVAKRASAAGGHRVPALIAQGGIRANDAEDRLDADEFEASLRAAADTLTQSRGQSYASALEALPPEIREYWLCALEDDELGPEAEQKHAPTIEGLLRFLTEDALAELSSQRKNIDARPAIRRQAQGESFDPDRLSRIADLEERLDREFERNLAMLLKLQEVRMKAQNAG